MAVQTEGSSLSYTAETVGHAFVQQFYTVLHDKPDVAHQFFQDSSTMSRPGPDGSVETVTSMEGIKQLILSLDCQDFIIEILTADAQASYGNGVAVLVTGCLTGKDNVRRKFTELFFLAPQESGYFVYNNAFRFIEEESSPVVNSVEEKDDNKSEPASHMIPIEETTDATTKVTPTVEDKIETISTSTDEHKPAVKEKAVPKVSGDSGHTVQPVCEPLSDGPVDARAPKLSYVQTLLHNAKEGGRTVLVNKHTNGAKAPIKSTTKKTVQQTRDASAPAVQQTPATAAPSATSDTSASNGSKVINGNNDSVADQAEDNKGYSIYIGGLPYNASVEQVELEFKKFGRIRSDGIQVRSNKGYCFGFVEFEDASGQQKAIQVGKVSIDGKEATIEFKRTGTKVVNGVNVHPSGRGGGYRNDGFRGRGNYSNGGGRAYARNDYGMRNGADHGYKRNGDDYGYKRNGEYSSRSNNRNNGDGYVYQNGNGGGRSARQGAPSK